MMNILQYKTLLKELLIPSDIVDTVEDIRIESLYHQGYRTLLIDVDNTLLTYEQREASLQKIHWIEAAKSLGYSIFLISNNFSKRRIARVCKQLRLTGLYFACKPFTFALNELAEKEGIHYKTSIFIGDQLLKDVVIGNWLGMHSILVTPMDIRKSFFKTLQRDIELWLLTHLSNDRL